MTSARAVLPPAPRSAAEARRLVKQTCDAGGAGEFVDTAVLLTSELVTNAVVHAHSPFEVLIASNPGGVRVEVRDRDDQLPVARDYDTDASTGRGTLLLAALADSHGAELVENGKRVWFSLGVPPSDLAKLPGPVHQILDAPVTVSLLGLPADLYRAWQQHADGLLREAYLGGTVMSPAEHGQAARALGLLGEAAARALDHAPVVDIGLHTAATDVLSFGVLRGALGKATAAAAAGTLLSPPGRPELAAFRDWCCDEVARQANGLPPQAWSKPTAIDARGSGVRAACLAVRGSAAAEVVADEHGVFVGVSRAADRLLGWPEGHLEGAAVTAVIPEDLIAAHTAGWHRLQTTGEGRILDRGLNLPARRRDGSIVQVRMTISQRQEPDGRLFHASFEATQTPTALNPPST